jgi:gamma-glutamyltranspeptidase / glutathione hydrolase
MTSMIVCPQPLAAVVGRDVFAGGGNAVDAAVAAAFVQSVTDPLMCGLGGTGLLYYYDGKKREHTVLNCEVALGSRPVPSAWAGEYVGRAETIGRYIISSEANQVGHWSVMIPGFVRGCWTAHQRFGSGKLAWADLLAPAARLAEEGFVVDPYVANQWFELADAPGSLEGKPGYPGLMTKLGATPDAGRIYLKPDGSGYQTGDLLKQPELGRTIRRLADAGGDDYYTGEIAAMIAADFDQHGGFITAEDLRGYRVLVDEPYTSTYRGLDVTSTPVPSSGPQLLQLLQILDRFDLAGLGHNSPAYIDTFARAQRAVFADYVRQKGLTPEDAEPLIREALSAERTSDWAGRIENGDRIVVRGGSVDPGTTHLTCIDEDRNIVCFTHSIGSSAGSGVIVPGLGFLLNNFVGHFNVLPGRPDSIVAGKRMGGGVPTIVFRDGTPYIAIGAPGGSRLMTSTVQSIVNVVDHGMDMATAVTVPRFHSEEQQLLFVEPALPEATAEALRALGNDVQRSTYMSRVQAIRIRPEDGELEAGPDPRGGAGVGRFG